MNCATCDLELDRNAFLRLNDKFREVISLGLAVPIVAVESHVALYD